MRTRVRIVAAVAIATAVVGMTAASADTVTGAGIVSGPRYRGGVQSEGEINYGVSIQVNKDSTGAITAVRGAVRITKVSKAKAVQIDTVVLGTSTAAVLANNSAVNSGSGPSALSYTPWRGVAPGTCTDYRTRANFSVRWADGALSKFFVLSPLTRVCRSAPATSCTPGYSPCIPPGSDVDCAGGSGNGPRYVAGPVRVTGSDPYDLDADHDGFGCEG